MVNKDIVVIGASTGGLNALKALVGQLPKELKASIFVVVHVRAGSPSVLPGILSNEGPLPATEARNWEEIRPGHIYTAPSDHHLLLEKTGYMRITRGPKENLFRPAIDPLFRSAASAFGSRVVGIILTGNLDDGTAGLLEVKHSGGTTIVQDPRDATAASMPLSALKHVAVDHCVPLSGIGPIIVQLANTPATEAGPKSTSPKTETEIKIAKEENAQASGILDWGDPSFFACPECHGVLLQLKEGNQLRFRCHTGHAYSLEALFSEFQKETEETLWKAVRSLEETVLLLNQMARKVGEHGHNEAADELLLQARDFQQRAERVREVVRQGGAHLPDTRTQTN